MLQNNYVDKNYQKYPKNYQPNPNIVEEKKEIIQGVRANDKTDIEHQNINNNQNQQNQIQFREEIKPIYRHQNKFIKYNLPPEQIYCEADIKSTKCCCKVLKPGVGIQGMLIALKQIHDQYQDMNFVNIELRYNQLSRFSYYKKIFEPLVASSQTFSPQQIREGKVIYCTNFFFYKLRQYSIYLLTVYAITIFLQTIGYGIILQHYSNSTTSAAKQLAIPFMIQIALWVGIYIFSIIGIFTSNIKLFKTMIIFKRINFFYGIFVSAFGIDIGVRESSSDNRQYVHLIISLITTLLGSAPVMITKKIIEKLRRFNILLRKISQDQIEPGFCY